MGSARGRQAKVVSIRLPDEQLAQVEAFLDVSEQETVTGAVQHLIELGLAAQAEKDYVEHRWSVGAAGMRQLSMERLTNTHRVVHDLYLQNPFAARALALELVAKSVEFAQLVNQETDSALSASMKKRAKK